MEKLTRRSTNGTAVYATPSGEPAKWENNRHNVLQKLADYEDSEEQGKLINLPCTVGDIVYVPTRDFISELRIAHIIISKNNIFFHWMLNTGIYPNLDGFSVDKIGKEVFLTESEAEMKLKELKCSISGRCKENKDIEDIER